MIRTLSIAAVLAALAAMPALAGELVTVKVNGMVCDYCAQSLKKVLGANEAVDEIGVDLAGGVVTVALKDGASLEDSAIREAILDSGYDVVEIARTPQS